MKSDTENDILPFEGMAEYQAFAIYFPDAEPQKPEHAGTKAAFRRALHKKPEHAGTAGWM
ncbi:hypothetical protein [uncultured Muribaculum sp.]|uniref:hypothetical protein n=1 Tax=uncultured Muribaculum sp. TaxID=1918613 RepID=UPI00263B32F2|nr:hypothetical protein [uncultured Muribaculum sp.]